MVMSHTSTQSYGSPVISVCFCWLLWLFAGRIRLPIYFKLKRFIFGSWFGHRSCLAHKGLGSHHMLGWLCAHFVTGTVGMALGEVNVETMEKATTQGSGDRIERSWIL